jgi:hypothetical protein
MINVFRQKGDTLINFGPNRLTKTFCSAPPKLSRRKAPRRIDIGVTVKLLGFRLPARKLSYVGQLNSQLSRHLRQVNLA